MSVCACVRACVDGSERGEEGDRAPVIWKVALREVYSESARRIPITNACPTHPFVTNACPTHPF
eukprot:2009000-Rhodomonas_salina.1